MLQAQQGGRRVAKLLSRVGMQPADEIRNNDLGSRPTCADALQPVCNGPRALSWLDLRPSLHPTLLRYSSSACRGRLAATLWKFGLAATLASFERPLRWSCPCFLIGLAGPTDVAGLVRVRVRVKGER